MREEEEEHKECGDPFQEDDLVTLNGTKEEVEKLQKAMEERRLKAKTAKKSKKSKDAKVSKSQDSAGSCDASETKSTSLNGEGSSGSSSDSAPGPSTSGECSKTLKAPAGTIAGSKRSIQAMKDKSEAYKSLFTSHSSAKRSKDQMSNWVTHTPYHF
ncbi:Replication termination factor 2 [Labeo rohita]|uniref:Replication termination factor 2 n=1 Tax=Labeo rohita TaxID=84645 RepID=A0ABQ8MM87_LABRO|nr:Replication termination factor 2 [Labeo rohita]